jgi:lysophospholipase L1-like esterase
MKSVLVTFRLYMVFVLLLSCIAGSLANAEPSAKSGKTAKTVSGPERWENTIRKFEETDATTPPPKGAVLLVGGSNARRWTDVGDYLPQSTVINRGFGGARLTDVLYFVDRIVLPYEPKVILLNAGGNDLSSGKSPAQVRDTARIFMNKVHAVLPETHILYIGLPHVLRAGRDPEALTAIRGMNEQLAELARSEKSFEFVDLFPAFLDTEGQPRPELFVEDGTHFSPKGYAILAGLLKGKF